MDKSEIIDHVYAGVAELLTGMENLYRELEDLRDYIEMQEATPKGDDTPSTSTEDV